MDNTNYDTKELCEIYKAEIECLRKIIKEKDEFIEFLKQQLSLEIK